jgi:prephenate dehydrogenase
MTSNHKPTLVIIGLGLLGASIADCLRNRQKNYHLIGVSGKKTLLDAQKSGLFNELYEYEQIEAWKSRAELILLCSPIEAILSHMKMLAECKSKFSNGTIISDVGSAKTTISEEAKLLFGDDPSVSFICGHPMAGSEKSGFQARSPILYESARWILCESHDYINQKAPKLLQLINDLGANPYYIDAHTHDAHMSKVSHLPQILATLLSFSSSDSPEAISISGPGFRDMTRLAESPFSMWISIFKFNQGPILQALHQYQILLNQCINIFQDHQWQTMESYFEKARKTREQIPIVQNAMNQQQFGVLVSLEDKPGNINRVVTPLSEHNLNICDIELLKNRVGVGGTLRIAFQMHSEAECAVHILEKQNITARLL